MDVELSAEESAALRQALETYLSELRMEIVDTDNPEFKRGLRSERALLEGVIEKLGAAAESYAEDDAGGQARVRVIWAWSR